METLNRIPECESHEAAIAIMEGYRALLLLREASLLDFIAENAFDKKAKEQCETAISDMEDCMSPNLRLVTLASYTKVRFSTSRDPMRMIEGLVRDMAWDRTLRRRITTTGERGGWEFFSDADVVFTHFEILDEE